jgi:hypothetical protein
MASKTKSVAKRYFIFTYSIDHLAQKDKVLFYYALKGRDGKSGILGSKGIIQMGRTVVLVPASLAEEFSEFLEHWKCSSKKREILLEK